MGAWAKLASRAAFRKGQASYCGYINAVRPGMWSGGVVGLKSILGSRSRAQSLEALSKLSELGYVRCSLNYNPAPPVAQSHNTEPVQEEPPKKKSSRKRNLYSTAQPPTGF